MVQTDEKPADATGSTDAAAAAQEETRRRMMQQFAAPTPTDPRQISLQWGTRVKPSNAAGGLTINDINVGIYAHIPEHVESRNRLPRGAMSASGLADV
ncbi:MAG: hypothetical protein IIA54_08620, partial [Chloroflexi bacterium]|nr:hypothetical protein [Chloroflexota bacterium]